MDKKSYKERIKENKQILSEIYMMIKTNKKWWLMPIFMVFAFLTLFLTLAGGGSVLPAIYALF
ncbi:MAG: hypothetical protein CME70_09010 [Halobacteriovorax sp.]|nr:hypothetical protein [Halobacteriovorax sp.]|tara:strand:+ start:42905 stop:43093 length:189 start_codon:yes stop_codon:yes gene_type:complete